MRKLISVLAIVFLFFSCISSPPEKNILSSGNTEIKSDRFSFSLLSVNPSRIRIQGNGNTYFTPKDPNNYFFLLSGSFTNSSDNPLSINELHNFELVVYSVDKFEYFSWGNNPTEKIDVLQMIRKQTIDPNESYSLNWAFTYPKKSIPLAITYKRELYIDFNQDNFPRELFSNEITRNKAFNNLISLFPILSDEQIIETITTFNFNYFQTSSSTENIFIDSIMYKKNKVFDNAVKNSSELNNSFRYGMYTIRPIHLCLLANNEYALDFLLKQGIELPDNESFGSIRLLVDTQNIDGLTLASEKGIDIKSFVITNGLQKSRTIKEYAEINKLDKVLEYLNKN